MDVYVHGDDFIALGDDVSQQKYKKLMESKFTIKWRAVIGPDEGDDTEVRILNRYCRFVKSPEHIELEEDPRHAQLIVRQLRKTQISLLKILTTWK